MLVETTKVFKIGQRWKTRDGKHEKTIMIVKGEFNEDQYPIVTTDHTTYRIDGQYLGNEMEGNDLVSLISEPTQETIAVATKVLSSVEDVYKEPPAQPQTEETVMNTETKQEVMTGETQREKLARLNQEVEKEFNKSNEDLYKEAIRSLMHNESKLLKQVSDINKELQELAVAKENLEEAFINGDLVSREDVNKAVKARFRKPRLEDRSN